MQTTFVVSLGNNYGLVHDIYADIVDCVFELVIGLGPEALGVKFGEGRQCTFFPWWGRGSLAIGWVRARGAVGMCSYASGVASLDSSSSAYPRPFLCARSRYTGMQKRQCNIIEG